VQFVADAEIMQQAGIGNFNSTDDMIRNGLHLNPEEIRLAVDWLKITDPKHEVPLNIAVRLGQYGGDRRSQVFKDQGDNITLKERGNSHRKRVGPPKPFPSDLRQRPTSAGVATL
jgi:hypothetical protein